MGTLALAPTADARCCAAANSPFVLGAAVALMLKTTRSGGIRKRLSMRGIDEPNAMYPTQPAKPC
jgi:hypothetical protein